MSRCEDSVEGAPPTRSCLCGDADIQSKVQWPEQQLAPEGAGSKSKPKPKCQPELSVVSLKSNHSMHRPLVFGDDDKETFIQPFLGKKKQAGPADFLLSGSPHGDWQRHLKSQLKTKLQFVFEGSAGAGKPAPLKKIYTDLSLTEGGSEEVGVEHEVRQIEPESGKRHRPEKTIKCEDIFRLSPEKDPPIRTVVTEGVAGIGKTVLTQKVTLDWAEDKSNQNIQLLFPIPFRQLNVLQEKKCSLVELLDLFFNQNKKAGLCGVEAYQVAFIFDGLDECRLTLDFQNNPTLTDVKEPAPVEVLMTNLIKGNLLPAARLWITTRPAAASKIPAECVDMVTKVRGFTDPQKEEYFKKRFTVEEPARRIISLIKTRSLHAMCHIPIFCWIIATVLGSRAEGEPSIAPTEMYIYFLMVQSMWKNTKYGQGADRVPQFVQDSRKMIECLGKLAFKLLLKGNLFFYESDLTEGGTELVAAAIYSGVFTQTFTEKEGLYRERIFCFVHPSVLEFLAAVHVNLTFFNRGVNLLSEDESNSLKSRTTADNQAKIDFYRSAVDKVLQRSNGNLDWFLRFLMGLSLQTNQVLLQGLLSQQPPTASDQSKTCPATVAYIIQKIKDSPSAEKTTNLLHCLKELNDGSPVERVQQSTRTRKLSPAPWAALVLISLSSEKDLGVFHMKKYSSSLTELDLSNNLVKDSGVVLLCVGPRSPRCRPELLRLSGCLTTEGRRASVASALSSNASRLTKLDLSCNRLRQAGAHPLPAELEGLHWSLDVLRLENAGTGRMRPGTLCICCVCADTRIHFLTYNGSFPEPL